MQLTRIDRWLKVKFVYETQILTLRPVEHTPKGMRRVDLSDTPGRRFKHLYKTSKPKVADKFLTALKEDNQMFSTSVVDKDTWLAQFVAPEGKSPTWYVVSVFFLMSALAPIVSWLRDLIKDPEFLENMKGVMDILKG
jgi:hypothetical protein